MIEFLPYLLPTTLYALVAVFSFYLYQRVRRVGFLVIGISFLIGTIPNLVTLAFGGPYLAPTLSARGWDALKISTLLSILGILQMSIVVISTVLVLVGLVQLSRTSHTKQ